MAYSYFMDNRKLVDGWNAAFPIAARVTVALDSGAEMHTETRSKAWLLGGHTAVVLLKGIAGCYDLRRVRAPKPEV